jgi:4-carboxymuconolactone decarboxylase
MISRIPFVDPERLSVAGRDIYASILETRGNVEGPFLVWLHSPGLAAPAERLGAFCRYNTSLTKVESELLILTVAAHFRCTGEWQIHAAIALEAGLDGASIDAIRTGGAPVLRSFRLTLMHALAAELLRHNSISRTTFARARDELGDQEFVETVGVIGYYSFVAMTLNAFEIRYADRDDPFESPPGQRGL